MPESVELEATQQLIEQGLKAIEDMRRSTRWLEQLAGQPVAENPFDETSIRHGIERRWQELAPVIRRLPLSLKIVRAAVDRVIKKAPPAERSEQFRDCCLWEQAVQIARHCEVHWLPAMETSMRRVTPQAPSGRRCVSMLRA